MSCSCRSCCEHRHDADREVARDAAADLEEADRALAAGRLVPVREDHHVLDAGAHRVHVLDVARDAVAAKMLPSVESSQPGTNIGRFFSRRREQPAVLRVDLVVLLEHARAQDPVEELVREVAAAAPCPRAATPRARRSRCGGSPPPRGCRCRSRGSGAGRAAPPRPPA